MQFSFTNNRRVNIEINPDKWESNTPNDGHSSIYQDIDSDNRIKNIEVELKEGDLCVCIETIDDETLDFFLYNQNKNTHTYSINKKMKRNILLLCLILASSQLYSQHYYKIQFDDGVDLIESEAAQTEVSNHEEFKMLNDSERSEFMSKLETVYDQAGQSGSLKISSVGNEISGFSGINPELRYKSSEEIESIKNRKERRAAREEYNRNATQNRIFAESLLRIHLRKKEKN